MEDGAIFMENGEAKPVGHDRGPPGALWCFSRVASHGAAFCAAAPAVDGGVYIESAKGIHDGVDVLYRLRIVWHDTCGPWAAISAVNAAPAVDLAIVGTHSDRS